MKPLEWVERRLDWKNTKICLKLHSRWKITFQVRLFFVKKWHCLDFIWMTIAGWIARIASQLDIQQNCHTQTHYLPIVVTAKCCTLSSKQQFLFYFITAKANVKCQICRGVDATSQQPEHTTCKTYRGGLTSFQTFFQYNLLAF